MPAKAKGELWVVGLKCLQLLGNNVWGHYKPYLKTVLTDISTPSSPLGIRPQYFVQYRNPSFQKSLKKSDPEIIAKRKQLHIIENILSDFETSAGHRVISKYNKAKQTELSLSQSQYNEVRA